MGEIFVVLQLVLIIKVLYAKVVENLNMLFQKVVMIIKKMCIEYKGKKQNYIKCV